MTDRNVQAGGPNHDPRPRSGRPRQAPVGGPFPSGDPTASSRAGSAHPARRSPDLLQLMSRLQPRDYVLAHLLDQHRTLSTAQITAVLFTSPGRARNRLYTLRRAGFIDCFTHTRGTGPRQTLWIAGTLSARYVAHHAGRTPPTARALQDAREAIACSAHLDHTVGANQFFVDLLTASRALPDARLARWWSPARTAAALSGRVHPDGHGVWERDGRQVGFFLEHDTGTEPLTRLIAKIEPYRRLRADGGPDYPLLFWLPSPTREANLHRRLNGTAPHLGVTIATAHRDPDRPGSPADAIWKLAGNGRRRYVLHELPSHPGRPGPYHPGPPRLEDDPLQLLSRRHTG